VSIGSIGDGLAAQIGTADQAIRTPDQAGVVAFHQRVERQESESGNAIKRTERAIILLDEKSRQEEAHEHVVDVRTGD
jgi:ABC-type proline/glycine betaine transport system ATPase subunit